MSVAGVRAVYGWEAAKLVRQVRVRAAVAVCLVGPFVGALVLQGQSTLPVDTLFGRFVHDSGFAVPLLVLGFAGLWAVPALTSVVAGDAFAVEDRHGTWRVILTRSRGRGELFLGKVLATATYAVVVVSALAAASVVAGLVVVGHQPLVGLTGQPIAAGEALRLVVLAWLSALAPTLVFTALGVTVSVVTRNGPAGVGLPVLVSLGLTLLGLAGVPTWLRLSLPGSAFLGWRGLFAEPAFTGPLTWGLVASACWTALLLAVAWLVFARRGPGGL